MSLATCFQTTGRGLRWAAAVMGVGLAAATTVMAAHAAQRLDDQGTHTMPPNVQMQWRSVGAAGPASARQMEAQLTIALRLDTRAFAGRLARIYMVMPQDSGSSLQAQWVSRGRVLPGRIAPGERTLIFQGVVPHQTLEDQLVMQLLTDGAWMSDSRRLDLFFELDTE